MQKYATPLEEATTPSLEALKAYSLGQKTEFAKGDDGRSAFLQAGGGTRPEFRHGLQRHVGLSTATSAKSGRAAENARKAYELREKVSERERFAIEAIYYLYATGELEKAAQIYELWQQTYPRDYLPYDEPGDSFTAALGNWEKALEEVREAMRLEPNDETNYRQPRHRSTRTSTGWMRRRRCTSRRRSASWRASSC